MTSEAKEAYVWIWLPGAVDPVVAGVLTADRGTIYFTYAKSYLRRSDAISIYEPELPLGRGPIAPGGAAEIAGCIADAGPDAWGRAVLDRRHPSRSLTPLDYLALSGSDRIGALDFQASPTDYVARPSDGELDELLAAAQRVESGVPFSAPLDDVLVGGSSIGGARPKALVRDGQRRAIAKFASRYDLYPVVNAEALAMCLASSAGIDVPPWRVVRVTGQDALIIDRFDRPQDGTRRSIVSAATMLELGSQRRPEAATYPDLADLIRRRFTQPDGTLRELFTRIAFNVVIGNTDDHARNHAAFWDGSSLALTPAFDICPQAVRRQYQSLALTHDGDATASLPLLCSTAASYHLDPATAAEIVESIVDTVRDRWAEAVEAAQLTEVAATRLLSTVVLQPAVFEAP